MAFVVLIVLWILCLMAGEWGGFVTCTIMLIIFGCLELNVQTKPLSGKYGRKVDADKKKKDKEKNTEK